MTPSLLSRGRRLSVLGLFALVTSLAAPLAASHLEPPGSAGVAPPPAPPPSRAPSVAAAPTLRLDSAVVIGASVSAGFGCVMRFETLPPATGEPGGGEHEAAAPPSQMCGIVLADVLAATSADPGAKPASFATQRFFSRPEDFAEATLSKALDKHPTLVFAADYLFWHAYGWEWGDKPEESRAAKFERGLKRLEKFGDTVPIVVGDLPDMRHATLMLRPGMVPEKETLAKLNVRLREWAAGRKNVVVLPLDTFVRSALAGQAVSMGGREWSVSDVQSWLQGDGLHATPEGTVALAIAMLHALDEAKLLPEGATWEHDPSKILKRIVPAPPTKPAKKSSTN